MKLNPKKNKPEQDVVMTPPNLAKQIIFDLKPEGSILDPCRGEGAFFNNYPKDSIKYWCELSEGRDFFECEKKVDWIITNPPWSIYRKFCQKAYEVAENVAFLITTNHDLSLKARLRDMEAAGFGVKAIYYYNSPHENWPQSGFQLGVVHKQKGYKGPTTIHNMGNHGQEDYSNRV